MPLFLTIATVQWQFQMLKLQGREGEEWRQGRRRAVRVCRRKPGSRGRSQRRKKTFWQGLWKAVLQNYNPAGEPPTICWQHHKNQRSMQSMQNPFTEDDMGRGDELLCTSALWESVNLELVSGCCSTTGVREDDTKMVGRPEKKKKRECLWKN